MFRTTKCWSGVRRESGLCSEQIDFDPEPDPDSDSFHPAMVLISVSQIHQSSFMDGYRLSVISYQLTIRMVGAA